MSVNLRSCFLTSHHVVPAMRRAGGGAITHIASVQGYQNQSGVLAYAYAAKFREREAYRWVVETSIYVAGAVQGQGVGRLLYEALIDTLRAQGFTQAIGAIALPNDHSIALHEAVGFRRAGFFREVGYKHGRWIDVGYWQCELNDAVTPPNEPRPFSEVGLVRD